MADQKKTKQVLFWETPDLLEKFKDQAKSEGMTLSGWIRYTLIKGLKDGKK